MTIRAARLRQKSAPRSSPVVRVASLPAIGRARSGWRSKCSARVTFCWSPARATNWDRRSATPPFRSATTMPFAPRYGEKPSVAETALWTIEDVIAATRGELRGSPRLPINDVSIDSRKIAPGDIFVAIKGDRLDGHQFAAAALEAGAALAVVSRPTPEMASAGALLVVPEPLRALEDLGRWARRRSAAQIVAITGSVGQT